MDLALYFNYLHCNITSKFGLLKELHYLGMYETHIQGPIPDTLDNMHQIK